MIDARYLYGLDPKEFADLPYKEAIRFKYEAGKVLAKELDELMANELKTKSYNDLYELRLRIHRVLKAVRHNKMLLDELGL